MNFYHENNNVSASWFGLPIRINEKLKNNKNKIIKILESQGVETRPIISGNFLNQPCINLYNLKKKGETYLGSQEIENRGFFIGLPTKIISNEKLNFLVKNLFKIDKLA